MQIRRRSFGEVADHTETERPRVLADAMRPLHRPRAAVEDFVVVADEFASGMISDVQPAVMLFVPLADRAPFDRRAVLDASVMDDNLVGSIRHEPERRPIPRLVKFLFAK